MTPTKIPVLFIHGMGHHEPDFFKPFLELILKKLPADVRERICPVGCWWDNVTQPMQDYVFQKALKYKIGWKSLHKFSIDALGDPVSYLSAYYTSGRPFYKEIHDRLLSSLKELELALGEQAQSAPLVVFAHSLGSVILTNYIWDCQHGTPQTSEKPETAIQRMENLTCLITYGSNIPLFLGIKDPEKDKVKSIQFPEQIERMEIANWYNIFSPNDVLGWPLTNLWTPGFGPQKPIVDKVMSVGPWWWSWSPKSHTLYETDSGFVTFAAGRINELAKAVV